MDIDKIKTKIRESVESSFGSIFDEIEELNSIIEKKKGEIATLGKKYLNVFSKIQELEKESKQIQREAKERIVGLEQKEDEMITLENKIIQEQNNLRIEKEKVLLTVDKKKQELEEVQNEIKKTKHLLVAKEQLEDSIIILKDTSKKTEEELLKKELKLDTLISEKEKEYKAIEEVLAKLKKEHEKELSLVIPKRQELEKREKALAIKENDFNVMVSRHNKMFVGNNVRFKVK